MNTERLHAIALALREDLQTTEAPGFVEQFAQALRNGDQAGASSFRTQLEERLGNAPSNAFSPAWREALEEFGIGDSVGDTLLERITAITERNEITPVAAADELP